mmetsp:Transcript_40840/g.53812  ORF Transcript_40840/g.53812 Transcript_40840/m.53812 type:complete len:620 (+) Transcript_40840:2-1861(+)
MKARSINEVEVSHCKSQNTVLKQQLAMANARVAELEEEVHEQSSKVQKTGAEGTSRYVRLFLENSALKEKFKSAEAKIKILEDAAGSVLKQQSRAPESEILKAAMVENESLKDQINYLKQKVESHQIGASDYLEKAELTAQNQELKQRCEDLAAQLALVPPIFEKTMSGTQTTVSGGWAFVEQGEADRLSAHNLELQEQLDELKPKMEKFQALVQQLEELDSASSGLSLEEESVASRRHTLWVSMPYLEQISPPLHKRISDLHQHLIKKEAEVEDLKGTVDGFDEKIAHWNDQILHLDQEIDRLTAENARLTHDLLYEQEAKQKIILNTSMNEADMQHQLDAETSQEGLVEQSVMLVEQQQQLNLTLQNQLEEAETRLKLSQEEISQLKATSVRTRSRLRQGLLKALPAVQALQKRAQQDNPHHYEEMTRSQELQWAQKVPLGTSDMEGNELVDSAALCLQTLSAEVLSKIQHQKLKALTNNQQGHHVCLPSQASMPMGAMPKETCLALTPITARSPSGAHKTLEAQNTNSALGEQQLSLRGWSSGEEAAGGNSNSRHIQLSDAPPMGRSRTPMISSRNRTHSPLITTPSSNNTKRSLKDVAAQIKEVQTSISKLRNKR